MQKSRNRLDYTHTEEDLEIQYQEIYANNQREKQKSTNNQELKLLHQSTTNNIIINARPHVHRKCPTVKEQSQSIERIERI